MKSALLAALSLAAALAVSACSVTTETEPPRVGGYATIYASDVPPDIYAAPRVEYEGGYAYYARGRWYYPTTNGWVVFRDEPPALVRHRRYIQAAPPAPAAPPAHYRGNERYERREIQQAPPAAQPAPPAVRVH